MNLQTFNSVDIIAFKTPKPTNSLMQQTTNWFNIIRLRKALDPGTVEDLKKIVILNTGDFISSFSDNFDVCNILKLYNCNISESIKI